MAAEDRMDVFVARSLTAIRSHTSFFGDTDLKECIDATLSASARRQTPEAEDAGLTRDAARFASAPCDAALLRLPLAEAIADAQATRKPTA